MRLLVARQARQSVSVQIERDLMGGDGDACCAGCWIGLDSERPLQEFTLTAAAVFLFQSPDLLRGINQG